MHDLPFQTITQLAGLGLTLIAGWFLGLASHGGGRKWRARLEEAETENAGYRDRAESDLREAARRIRDLEAENTRLKAAPPAPVATPAPAAEPEGHSTTTVAAAAVAGAVAGAAVTHAVEEHAEAVQAPAHAETAHVETAHAETAHAEPASEPAPAEPVHDTPAEQAAPAHPEHTPSAAETMALPFETATQFAALGLTLVGGWFLGLASRSGGTKWRERYQDEELEHARYRDEAEGRLHALQAELKAARSQVSAPAAPVAADEAPGGGWRGWFGWGRDNLARVKGIDEAREKRLNELGIKTYREIEKMAPDDEAALEQRLGVPAGTIAEQGWREQAALLRAGNEREHAEKFG